MFYSPAHPARTNTTLRSLPGTVGCPLYQPALPYLPPFFFRPAVQSILSFFCDHKFDTEKRRFAFPHSFPMSIYCSTSKSMSIPSLFGFALRVGSPVSEYLVIFSKDFYFQFHPPSRFQQLPIVVNLNVFPFESVFCHPCYFHSPWLDVEPEPSDRMQLMQANQTPRTLPHLLQANRKPRICMPLLRAKRRKRTRECWRHHEPNNLPSFLLPVPQLPPAATSWDKILLVICTLAKK